MSLYEILSDGTKKRKAGAIPLIANSVVAGQTRTNVNDTVVEYYVSSDGMNWYRKWASGWKECGLIGTAQQSTSMTLPISFSNTLYTITGSVFNSSYQNAIRIEVSTVNTVKVTTGVQSSGYFSSSVRLYACGY